MTPHLEDRVALWVSTHPGSTVEEIARGVLARNLAVKDVLKQPLFTYSRAGGARRYRLGKPLDEAHEPTGGACVSPSGLASEPPDLDGSQAAHPDGQLAFVGPKFRRSAA